MNEYPTTPLPPSWYSTLPVTPGAHSSNPASIARATLSVPPPAPNAEIIVSCLSGVQPSEGVSPVGVSPVGVSPVGVSPALLLPSLLHAVSAIAEVSSNATPPARRRLFRIEVIATFSLASHFIGR